jgi:hypothetical protein
MVKRSRMKKLILAIILASWASALSGCSDMGSQACTEIACGGGVMFKLGKPAAAFSSGLPLTIKLCIDASPCSEVTVDAKAGAQPTCAAVDSPSSAFASCSVAADGSVEVELLPVEIKDPTGSHEAHVTIRDAADAVVLDKAAPVSIQVSYPNGEDCEPACYDGSVEVQP